MTAEDAVALLDMQLPLTRKLSCPRHSDSDPSLHVYPDDQGFYCFACSEGGDGWDLLSWFTGRPVGELMRENGAEVGPRPRTRWQQIGDIQHRARLLGWDFTTKLRSHIGLGWIEQVADRVDHLYPWIWEKDIDEAPAVLDRAIRDLEGLYQEATDRGRMLYSVMHGRQGSTPTTTGEDQSRPVPEVREPTSSIRDYLLSGVSQLGGTQERSQATPATDRQDGATTRRDT